MSPLSPAIPATAADGTINMINLLPMPGSGAISWFDGHNVTEYMEWWNMIADMAKLTDSVRILTFQRYCAQQIKDEVRSLDGYEDQDWKVFSDAILKEYKAQDAVDRYITLGYLKSLAG